MKFNPNSWERGNGKRTPLRTLQELADEFGVTFGQLRQQLSRADAPKHALLVREKRWYNPVEMRRWWKSIN